MNLIVPIIVGAILLALIAIFAVGIAQGAICPKCPACGSRKGLHQDSENNLVCGLCGQRWPER